MPRPELPRVSPFNIPGTGYRFVDKRSLSEASQSAATIQWRRWLVDEYETRMDSRREKVGLCDDDMRRENRLHLHYMRIKERRPDYTWDDFEQDGHTYEYDHERDPRLPKIDLVALDGIEVVGQMPLMNIVTERAEPGRLTAVVQGTPGIKPPDGWRRPRLWARVYRYLLETDLEFIGGRLLDIIEFRWPQDLPPYRFRPQPWNDLGAMFDRVREGDFDETRADADAEAVRRIRRRAAG